MNGLRERMTKFMYGRYGNDQLGRVYAGLAVVCLVAYMCTRFSLLYLAGVLLLVYSMYRSFSRDITKMSAQNQKYLTWRYKKVARMAQHKTYRFYKCPDCRQKVRVPRGRGKIAITCPKCGTEFIKKS